MKIVRVDIVDRDLGYGENPILDSYYLIDPDKEKLEELQHKLKARLDYDYDETLSEEESEYLREIYNDPWGFIELFIETNFKTLNIDTVEIDY